MRAVSTLKLEWKRREGGGQTRRDFLDFIVDDQPLSELVGDQISCLGWLVPEETAKAIGRLLLNEAADLSNNRRTLYICPECGDIGCGAVSLVIERIGDNIIWRDFGYENNYDGILHTEGFKEVGPFTFDSTDYAEAIRKALITTD